MPTPLKEKKINEIREKLTTANGFVLTDFKGITVKDISDLRRKFRKEKVEYRIFKNTLTARAISDCPYSAIQEDMTNTTAIAIAYGDPVAPLKVLKEFEKIKKITVKSGVISGQIFNNDQLMILRELPSIDQLRATLLSMLQAPARGFVTVVSAGTRGLVQVLSQRGKKLEEAGK